MAEGRSDIPHGLTEVKMSVGPHEYGPLNVFEGQHMNTFCGGNYFVTTPKNEFLTLHRLHGGHANEEGQYWSVEQRTGTESYRHDMAVLQRWGNTLEKERTLLVPKGVLLFEGKTGAQGHYLGGGWQVFIPRSIVQPLFELQETLQQPSYNEQRVADIISRMNSIQNKMVNQWENERAHRITSELQKTRRGQFFNRLPTSVQKALSSGSSYNSAEKLPVGTYKLHEERLQRLDGTSGTMSVSVKLEYVKSVTTTKGSGRNVTILTTHYYNIIYTTEYK